MFDPNRLPRGTYQNGFSTEFRGAAFWVVSIAAAVALFAIAYATGVLAGVYEVFVGAAPRWMILMGILCAFAAFVTSCGPLSRSGGAIGVILCLVAALTGYLLVGIIAAVLVSFVGTAGMAVGALLPAIIVIAAMICLIKKLVF